MLHLVAGLWAHGDGELSDVQETELFQELIDSPLWFRLNATFQALVLAKLRVEFNYDAIDLMPNCDASLFTPATHWGRVRITNRTSNRTSTDKRAATNELPPRDAN